MGIACRGEADAQARSVTPGFVGVYGCRFGAMINSWRDLWGMGDFAFIFAQLAPVPGAQMHSPQFGSNWPALRLEQAVALPGPGSKVDTTGMAVLSDLGDAIR
eukprot:SAG31_NODE_10137_length_1179_cov_0.805556_2_plen_103_part_00